MAVQFPDPNVTTDYIAPNGTQYVYDSTDGKWIPIGFVDPILPDIDNDNQQITTIDDRYANILSETLTGDLNVLEPVEDLNAASKVYVDNVTTGDYLERDGDTMTGYLEGPVPAEDNHVSSKLYADENIKDIFVDKSGDEMTGTLTFESDPTELEPVVYKFNPCIVELTEIPGGNVTTTLDLGTDFFYIDDNVELKDTGEFKFSSLTQFDNIIVSNTSDFNLNGLLEVTRDTEDYITYQGPITFEKEIVTKEYIDDIFEKLTSTIPVGTIFFWVSNQNVPKDYFKCDGSNFDIILYPDLHKILQGTHGYSDGILPNFSDRFACHNGSPNTGNPGSMLSDLNAFTGVSDSKSMTMTKHKHTVTVSGGTHTHTYSISSTGSSHTTHSKYTSWSVTGTKSGGGSQNKNPDRKTTATMSTSTSTHTHDISIDIDQTDHTHTIYIYTKSGIGNHGHNFIYDSPGGDNTTRPLSFLGYWIIKNK